MKAKVLSYRTIIKKDGKYYHGYVPILPGCHTQGDTIEETKKNLREAITGFLQSLTKHHETIPQEKDLKVVQSIESFSIEEIFPSAEDRPQISYA